MKNNNDDKKSKNIMIKKKHFQVFIWNSKIHNAFLILLIFCVFLLFGAMQLQSKYIDFLENNVDFDKSEVFDYEYNVILEEDFLNKTGLNALNIAEMVAYFNKNEYDNVYYNIGYVEATMNQCHEDKCFEVTYRFNQNKGAYVDVLKKNNK